MSWIKTGIFFINISLNDVGGGPKNHSLYFIADMIEI